MTADWITIVVSSFAGALIIHAVACRLPLPSDRVVRFLAVGVLAGAGLVLVLARRHGIWSVETVSAALAYGFLCELYLFMFTMSISSISSNILVRLAGRDIALGEIDNLYSSEAMIRRRLDRLISTGFVHRSGDEVALTAKGRRSLQLFQSLRRFFRPDSDADA